MESVDLMIHLMEIVLYVSISIFIGTSFYLIRSIKKVDYDFIKDSVRSAIFPNLDLGFFGKLQKRYMEAYQNKLPALANRFSFFTLVIGFFLLFFLVIIRELSSY